MDSQDDVPSVEAAYREMRMRIPLKKANQILGVIVLGSYGREMHL